MGKHSTTRFSIGVSDPINRKTVKLHYFPETDSLYIDLTEKPAVDSQEISEGLVADFDKEGRVVGLDIQHAKENVALDILETVSLPNLKLNIK